MFGDDSDPTVTTTRVGFGEVPDAREGSMHCARRGSVVVQRGSNGQTREKRKPDWSGTVNAGKAIRGKVMKAKGETSTRSECKF